LHFVLKEDCIQELQIVSTVTDNTSNIIKTLEKVIEDGNEMEKSMESDMAEEKNEEHVDGTLDDVTKQASALKAPCYLVYALRCTDFATCYKRWP